MCWPVGSNVVLAVQEDSEGSSSSLWPESCRVTALLSFSFTRAKTHILGFGQVTIPEYNNLLVAAPRLAKLKTLTPVCATKTLHFRAAISHTLPHTHIHALTQACKLFSIKMLGFFYHKIYTHEAINSSLTNINKNLPEKVGTMPQTHIQNVFFITRHCVVRYTNQENSNRSKRHGDIVRAGRDISFFYS